MITTHPAQERFHTAIDWLDSWHSFSFGEHYDPAKVGYSVLRVINDDRVAPGMGFGMHPHRDMEIVTVVLRGALEHRDSLGNGSVLRPGHIQRMTAGRGIRHAELNPSRDEEVHLLQIWLLPAEKGLEPSYEEKSFADQKPGEVRLIASPDGRGDSALIHQDASIYRVLLDADQVADQPVGSGRRAWVQVARGLVSVNGQTLRAGDGAAAEGERLLSMIGGEGGAELLIFDLP